ncbi:MAG: hypothetical protein J7518_02700 [Nocardioidaceae bacterium]|nr:hypothetical protein [Nocardioidaceae bacterium]
MTEILMTVLTTLVLLSGIVALALYARRDRFAGPGTGFVPYDELGPFADRRRAA